MAASQLLLTVTLILVHLNSKSNSLMSSLLLRSTTKVLSTHYKCGMSFMHELMLYLNMPYDQNLLNDMLFSTVMAITTLTISLTAIPSPQPAAPCCLTSTLKAPLIPQHSSCQMTSRHPLLSAGANQCHNLGNQCSRW